MHYIKVRREPIGACNICGISGPLTWDHVPPKGGIELAPVHMKSIFQNLTGTFEGFKTLESQNGVKYRTICKPCNEKMGQKYDPVINSFALSVGRYLKTLLTLPTVINHTTKPAALIRGLLGHLIAAKVQHDEVIFDKQVAPLVFNESKSIPDNIHIFYWIFPYDFSCTLRDMAITQLTDPKKAIHFCHVIKYFPIGYLISDQPSYEGLDELTKYKNLKTQEETAIPIRLKPIRPSNWPEMVDDTRIIFGGQALSNSIFATRKPKKC